MESQNLFSDYKNPLVEAKAAELTSRKTTQLEKLESIFNFMRDEIKFGFPPKWDKVKASETIGYKVGYCNTKATLFVALCRAVGIPARLHYGLVNIEILRGIVPSFALIFLPKKGSHAWTDVQIGGEWKHIDSYVVDKSLHEQAQQKLQDRSRSIGYSIAMINGKTSCDFNFGEKGFSQMGAVVEDHGAWDDASEYFATSKYTKLNSFQLMFYPMLAKLCNQNIRKILSAGTS
jgi:hypothetical protein